MSEPVVEYVLRVPEAELFKYPRLWRDLAQMNLYTDLKDQEMVAVSEVTFDISVPPLMDYPGHVLLLAKCRAEKIGEA